ncbi:MAG: hypothetical protein M3N47_06410 [Chloroflexota bacterium]|nr:hypothetical protein [Chloroflexota bacterium]
MQRRLAVVARDGSSGVVERVDCRTAEDPERVTRAVVWGGSLRRQLTRDLDVAVGRTAVVSCTYRTVAGGLQEARRTRVH